jgi:hypothetical protein
MPALVVVSDSSDDDQGEESSDEGEQESDAQTSTASRSIDNVPRTVADNGLALRPDHGNELTNLCHLFTLLNLFHRHEPLCRHREQLCTHREPLCGGYPGSTIHVHAIHTQCLR